MTGTALKQVRLSKGIKQTFIADKIGVMAPNLNRLEGMDKPLRLTYSQWMAIKNTLNLDDIQMGAYE